MTQDFSPLIEWVLAGVEYLMESDSVHTFEDEN